jgi:excisionase family DNA binding protein
MYPTMAHTSSRYPTPSPATTPVRREAVSIDVAAELLDVSGKTVRRLVKAGTLRAFRVGRLWRIRRDELRRYSESR